jgi:hypothetical protein
MSWNYEVTVSRTNYQPTYLVLSTQNFIFKKAQKLPNQIMKKRNFLKRNTEEVN